MADFGVCGMMTDRGVQPLELARWVEDQGFESLWFGEHTHSPDPERSEGRDPLGFDQLYDPYVTLGAAAAVTTRLKLGLAVALLPQHHPILLAKAVASLDRISNGRILFGIGAGSRRQEVEDFGFAFADRWKVTGEFIQAIRTIWRNDLAEFEGRHVRFGPMRSWPKPVRPNGPPVLEGAFSKWTARRIADYADGWIAWDGMPPETTAEILAAIRSEWAKAGRQPQSPDLTMIMRIPVGSADARQRIDGMLATGFQRIVLHLPPDTPKQQWVELDWFAKLKQGY